MRRQTQCIRDELLWQLPTHRGESTTRCDKPRYGKNSLSREDELEEHDIKTATNELNSGEGLEVTASESNARNSRCGRGCAESEKFAHIVAQTARTPPTKSTVRSEGEGKPRLDATEATSHRRRV